MKLKITKYKLTGMLSMLVFWLSASSLHTRSELQHITLMTAVMFVACAVIYILLSSKLSAVGRSWCMAAPFAALCLIANLILDANCVYPFFILAVMAVCAQRAREISKKESHPVRPILILAGFGLLSIAIFAAALLSFGVTL